MPSFKSVLVIEGDDNLRETLDLIIRRQGYCVASASNIADALLLLRSVPIDVVIVDLDAGEDAELQAFAELRSAYPNLQILVLTGNPQFDLRYLIQEFNIYKLLQKPVDPDLILGCVADSVKPA